MECREVIERMWEYLDGELAAKEAAAIRGHLSGCSSCHPCCQHDRAFLLVLVRSLNAPCRVPSRMRAAMLATLAAAKLGR